MQVNSVTVRVPSFPSTCKSGHTTHSYPLPAKDPPLFQFRPLLESRPLQTFFTCPFPLFRLCIQINHKGILQPQIIEHHTSPPCCSSASHPDHAELPTRSSIHHALYLASRSAMGIVVPCKLHTFSTQQIHQHS